MAAQYDFFAVALRQLQDINIDQEEKLHEISMAIFNTPLKTTSTDEENKAFSKELENVIMTWSQEAASIKKRIEQLRVSLKHIDDGIKTLRETENSLPTQDTADVAFTLASSLEVIYNCLDKSIHFVYCYSSKCKQEWMKVCKKVFSIAVVLVF